MDSNGHECPRSGKVIHNTQAWAEVHLNDLKKRLLSEGIDYPGRVYFCKSCGGWHVGRTARPRRVSKRR